MDIVNNFKNHLLAQKSPPSKVTIKNYLSDVRRFITWYEQRVTAPFNPSHLSSHTLTAYQTEIMGNNQDALPAVRSAKRYISSLRRFGQFLADSGTIEANPFAIVEVVKPLEDPWYMKEFKNFLYSERASKLTIKNYIIDVKQFLTWLEQVTNEEPEHSTQDILLHISSYALESYKMRLLNEAQLSPVSINRKLSSIRRYVRWLEEKGVIERFLDTQEAVPNQAREIEAIIPEIAPVNIPLPLTALQGLAEEEQRKKTHAYSSFGPIRLFQKTAKVITLGADLLFFNPIAASTEAIQYKLLKRGSKQVFAPVKAILEASSFVPEAVSVKTIIPKATSIMPPRFANTASVAKKLINFGISNKPDSVRNFTKALYAPLQISTKHMNWKQKLIYHIRYTRPAWYRAYHSYRFVTYLHFAILFLATGLAGINLYHAWTGPDQKQSEAVLSAQDTAPPRTLSFKGRLLDKTNTPITAETPLRFALYNSPTATGAAMLWEEKQDIKPDQNGNFTAELGKKQRLNQSVFSDSASLYVGISVNGNSELLPRQQLPTTSYAANAQTVQGLKPITETPDKAANVLLALDSSGNLTIGGSSSPTFQATGGQFKLSGQSLILTTNLGSNGNITLAPDGSGIIDLQRPLQNTSNYNNPSGINGAIEVDDVLSVYTASASQSALVVNQNGGGDIISGNSNGVAKFRLDSSGNELIAGSLVVNGNTIGTNATSFGIATNNVINLSIGTSASSLSLGASSGVTSINNNLSVHGTTTLNGTVTTTGLLSANGGITVGQGQKLALADFTPGSIAFIDGNKNLAQNATRFTWLDNQQSLKIVGSLCVRATDGVCGSTPGTIYASNATVQAADLAENYTSAQKLEPGDVVIPEGLGNNAAVIKSSQPYQKQLIGIISTKPGFTLNSDATTDPAHPNVYPLALQGRVPVKISSVNGPIQAGDDLTSSPIPGVAMKATGPGQTIGKALEAYTNTDTKAVGKIMVFANLSYHNDNPATLTAEGNLAMATPSSVALDPVSDLTSTVVKVGGVITNSLVATENVSINGVSLHDYIASVVHELTPDSGSTEQPAANNAAISAASMSHTASLLLGASFQTTASDSAHFASSSAFPIYNSIVASSSAVASVASASAFASPSATPSIGAQPTSASGSSVLDNAQNESSSSANQSTTDATLRGMQSDITSLLTAVSQLSNQAFANPSELGLEQLDVKDATVSGTLSVLGRTTLGDVGITGKITAGLMSIDGLNNDGFASLNTSVGPLKIQSDGLNGVDFLNGKVAIDTSGNLKVSGNAIFAQDVTVKGKLAANIIAPIPGSDLTVQNSQGKNVVRVDQKGDIEASGAGKFGALSIVRGVDADTSTTESVSNNSAGKGVIVARQIARTIYTPYVTAHSLIYVTPTSNTQNMTPYLARQTAADPAKGIKGSFTIQIPSTTTQNISFNWWIVN